jgi:hypothetical protein
LFPGAEVLESLLFLFYTESLYTEALLTYSSVRLITGMLLVAVLPAGTNAFVVVRGKGVELVKGIGLYAEICD